MHFTRQIQVEKAAQSEDPSKAQRWGHVVPGTCWLGWGLMGMNEEEAGRLSSASLMSQVLV